MDTIGLELEIARIIAGKTARDVGEIAGIHPTIISRIENGWMIPSVEQEARLKEAVGWTEELSFFVRVLRERTDMTRRCSRRARRADRSQRPQEGRQTASTDAKAS